MDDNRRGELTKVGAQLLAKALDSQDDGNATTDSDGNVTTHSFRAVGNRVQNLSVKGIRRKEIDVEELAMVYWRQAQRMVKERREKEAARLEKEQVRMDFASEPPKPAPKPPAPPKPSPKEVARLRRQLEATREQLRQMGVNPDDDESPQQREPELDAPQGP